MEDYLSSFELTGVIDETGRGEGDLSTAARKDFYLSLPPGKWRA